jgi:hypothetical protein
MPLLRELADTALMTVRSVERQSGSGTWDDVIESPSQIRNCNTSDLRQAQLISVISDDRIPRICAKQAWGSR